MVEIIAHVLVPTNLGFLILKRTKKEHGEKNVYAECWDIPGGLAVNNEVPREAAIRECLEETGLKIKIKRIIWEDSIFDKDKKRVFTRLVYLAHEIPAEQKIRLNEEEHSEFVFVKSRLVLNKIKVVPYLEEILLQFV
ncbi:MutT/NudX family protein [Lactiplantibacillus plantarum]|nr:MutT/NudX family protein [Lactiplantibacillus plantarum]